LFVIENRLRWQGYLEEDTDMCLIYAVFVFVGPRAGLALWWLVDQARFNVVYNNFFLPLLGFIFLPVTTIVWTIVWQVGGISG